MGAVKELAEQTGQAGVAVASEKGVTFPLAMKGQLEGARDQIMAVLPDRIDAERFIMVALTAITRNDALQECGLPSVFLAVMECARLGLFPDNREATIIPYKGVATLQPMVQGIVRLMLRSEGLLKVEARAVFEGDEFEFEYGLKPDLRHTPKFQSDKLTHAYAVLWRQGTEPTFEVVGRAEIEKARLSSRAPDSPAWKNWYPEMARKVAIKRMSKYADLSPEASRAIDLDNLVSGDPWGGREPEGVSPEYRNQLVRSQTQAGIERLKERMRASEATVEESGSEDLRPPTKLPTKTWPPAYIKELIALKLVDNAHNALAILELSPFEPEEPLQNIVRWTTIYRARRDEGLEEGDAIAEAGQQYRDSQ